MALIDPVLGFHLVFVLGLASIIAFILIFFSCRCLSGRKLAQRMQRFGWFNKFYRYHCYYWWFFFASMLLHSIIAILVFF